MIKKITFNIIERGISIQLTKGYVSDCHNVLWIINMLKYLRAVKWPEEKTTRQWTPIVRNEQEMHYFLLHFFGFIYKNERKRRRKAKKIIFHPNLNLNINFSENVRN